MLESWTVPVNSLTVGWLYLWMPFLTSIQKLDTSAYAVEVKVLVLETGHP
ncbi:hypothetical protein GOA55_10400 [Sinorhizobium meliloti]|nr:hypothetical protein [Sinorhizobium meliloti]